MGEQLWRKVFQKKFRKVVKAILAGIYKSILVSVIFLNLSFCQEKPYGQLWTMKRILEKRAQQKIKKEAEMKQAAVKQNNEMLGKLQTQKQAVLDDQNGEEPMDIDEQ